jgi:ABC-2 type transport system permease protein
MTDPAGPPAATIADVSYRNYDGPLHTRVLRWSTITLASLRAVRRKPAFWVLAALALLPYLIIGFMLYLGSSLGPLGRLLPQQKYPALFLQAFHQQQFWIFLLAILLGAGSIAADNQANALLVYLSKPITREDYLLGKWMGVLLPLLGVSCLPALALFIYCALSFTGGSFFHTEPSLLWRVALVTAVPPVLHASLITGFSAWSKSARLAGACYAGLYLLGGIVSGIFSKLELREHSQVGRLIEHLSISGVIDGLGQSIYRVSAHVSFGHHGGGVSAHSLPPLWVMLGTVVALVALGLVAARLKVRAVEVVRG